jgi:hypothetical protein
VEDSPVKEDVVVDEPAEVVVDHRDASSQRHSPLLPYLVLAGGVVMVIIGQLLSAV